jgi:hypothetical protein
LTTEGDTERHALEPPASTPWIVHAHRSVPPAVHEVSAGAAIDLHRATAKFGKGTVKGRRLGLTVVTLLKWARALVHGL